MFPRQTFPSQIQSTAHRRHRNMHQTAHPANNGHQQCRQRMDMLYQVIIRQESQVQQLEHQLAQSHQKSQHFSNEIVALRHLVYFPVLFHPLLYS